jgi:hypothetical protein
MHTDFQELQQVLVLFGQMKNHRPLSWNILVPSLPKTQ